MVGRRWQTRTCWNTRESVVFGRKLMSIVQQPLMAQGTEDTSAVITGMNAYSGLPRKRRLNALQSNHSPWALRMSSTTRNLSALQVVKSGGCTDLPRNVQRKFNTRTWFGAAP